MKIGEMRGMSVSEAKKQVRELKAELAKEKAVAAGGTRPENPGKIRGRKKNIARLLTIINEKARAGEAESPLPEKVSETEEAEEPGEKVERKEKGKIGKRLRKMKEKKGKAGKKAWPVMKKRRAKMAKAKKKKAGKKRR